MSVTDSGGEDRVLPAIVYGLYLLGLVTVLTIPIGLIIALSNRGAAGPRTQSHYVFQAGTVWAALGWWIIGGLMLVVGAILSVVLVGVPIFLVGLLIFAVGHIWFGLRCVLGAYYLLKGQAYPRPRTWLF